jgi:hypothetical protein
VDFSHSGVTFVRHSRRRWQRRFGLSGAALGALLAGVSPAARASITGVCPDGSIFIVQRPESIPCANAKQVDPGDVPPLKPEMLPRPYAWEVFNQQQSPNNPYNLVDAARQIRETQAAEAAATPSGEPVRTARNEPVAPSPVSAAPPQPPAPSAPVDAAAPLELGLSDDEARNLALIVELSQQRAPAAFAFADGGAPELSIRVAPSTAFEARLRDAWAQRGRTLAGPVVLFTARAAAPASFHPNFTFVQGHQAFHPDPGDPTQLGVIRGDLANLNPDADVLGYVVLPEQVELAQPLDIYCDDRQITATLRP